MRCSIWPSSFWGARNSHRYTEHKCEPALISVNMEYQILVSILTAGLNENLKESQSGGWHVGSQRMPWRISLISGLILSLAFYQCGVSQVFPVSRFPLASLVSSHKRAGSSIAYTKSLTSHLKCYPISHPVPGVGWGPTSYWKWINKWY